jgi:putative pantetheine hydrolase
MVAVAPFPGCGPTNSLHDIPGLRVGHATLTGDGWLTGVTVVVPPPDGAVGGVDVRGGGPGTRETDLLDPRNAVERVNAIVLGGGSAYGLLAAHGVMTRLAALGRGVRIGSGSSQVVPIVPAAILFDLGRGGVYGNYPGVAAGEAAFDDALAVAGGELAGNPVRGGNAGAGTGAVAGGLKGGIGSASIMLADPELERPVAVAALAAVNSAGSVADPRTGLLYGAQFGLPGEFDWLAAPSAEEVQAAAARLGQRPRGGQPEADATARDGEPVPAATPRPLNTTIGVVATDASLTKAQCAKLAGVAHDGMARAVRPAHSMFDGDTVFALATGAGPVASPLEFHAILTAAADCFARAIVHAVLAAASVTTKDRSWPSYLDLFPSADTR